MVNVLCFCSHLLATFMIMLLHRFVQLETRRIHPLAHPRPLGQFCRHTHVSSPLRSSKITLGNRQLGHLLCIPFLYFFSFRSKMVYLSLGNISSSRGISAYHLSIAFALIPWFFNAVLRVSTTLSTNFNLFRCRAF